MNADGTRAGKRSKRDHTLQELAYANTHEWNFAKLIVLVCAGLYQWGSARSRYKLHTTHNFSTRSDEGQANAWNVSF